MMHHRSTIPTQDIELFPFLSVLFCTIGTLILIVILLVVQASASNKKVKIVARNDSSVNASKTPRYIECRSEGVVIYPSQKFIPTENLRDLYSPFDEYLSEIEEAGEYLIVAIRPDGVEIFQTVREIAENRGIDLGYEPFDADWELNLKPEPTIDR